MAITEEAVRDALRTVIDPELGVNIVDLGLVYRIEIDGALVRIDLTMTSPACPLGEYIRDLVSSEVLVHLPEVRDVKVQLVWEPPWNADMMSRAAHDILG
jgi:metal-sulfur cluster biosynthetic enzyme